VDPRDQRYLALDGLRGFAAIAVVLFHCGHHLHASWLVGHGAVAVDVFFVMSGFVLHRIYGPRFRAGWSFRDFVRARFVRLYPLYFAGLLIGLGVVSALGGRDAWNEQVLGLLRAFIDGSLLIPDLSDPNGLIFPLNPTFWSLLVEAVVSLGYGLSRGRVGPRGLALLIGGTALVLTLASLRGLPLLVGGTASMLWANLCRGLFGFAIGMAIAALERRGTLQVVSRCPAWIAFGLLGAVMLVPEDQPRQLFDLCAILVAAPAICCFAVAGRLHPRCHAWCRMGGALSYPLYTVHAPVLFWMAQSCLAPPRPAANLAMMLTTTCICIAMALTVGLRVEGRLTRALAHAMA
jgi:peptidoglycan/LPS O-acetylase OafA/YrhL